MANEYLKRTLTSTGNTKKYTLSFWVKNNDPSQGYTAMIGAGKTSPNNIYNEIFYDGSNSGNIGFNLDNAADPENYTFQSYINGSVYAGGGRDPASWAHYVVSFDNTIVDITSDPGVHIYKNGSEMKISETTTLTYLEKSFFNDKDYIHYIGSRAQQGAGTNTFDGEFFDVYMVDGQALTPDVFGFYKEGKGYISAGSTQATDFRPGQWVPKKPSAIKNSIINSGGFGVNGYYLPMNDSSNFGADFHCTPNSIITLKGENLPQPQNGAPTTTDGYVSQLRTDAYSANLVLAVPGITGASGVAYTDFSANIKGSGTNKVLTAFGNAGVAATASYYGSAMSFDGSGDYFTIPANTSDLIMGSDDFTIEAWVNKNDTSNGGIFGLYDNGNNRRSYLLYSDNSGDLSAIVSTDGTSATNTQLGTSAATNLGTNQWHHCVLEREGSYLRLYLNGVVAGIATDLSGSLYENTTDTPAIGTWFNSGAVATVINGYIQDLRVYKGVAKYKGGFDVPKPYTPVGIGTWRAVPDTTANNFATLNGTSIPSKYTITEGNLRFTNSTTNWTGFLEGTVGFSTGKYYWETRVDVSTDYHHIGIVGVGITHFNTADSYTYGISYQTDGRFWAQSNGGSAFGLSKPTAKTVGDIVQVALDMNDKKMWIGINGNWIDSGDPIAGTGENFDSTRGFDYQHYVPFYDSYGSSGLSINFGQNPTFGGKRTAGTNTDDNGRGLFAYDVPTGFLALCEDNLPTPAIADPGDYFKTVLYTGDGNSGHSITGVGFQPDLVWVKARNGTQWHVINDSVRGANRALYSNQTYGENQTGSNPVLHSLLSFDSDGFSLGADPDSNGNGGYNPNGTNIVAWCWRAGAGTTSTNTDGSINSVVSVNQDAGFSIVSYTGNQTAGTTVGHGLGKTPSMIITKCRGAVTSWAVYHKSLGATNWILLNSTNATTVSNQEWNDTEPTSSVFTIGNGSANSNQSQPYIAYCWTEIEGFSKFGSYEGNASTDGPFVYCGFKPAVVIIKWADGSASWVIQDSSRTSTNPSTLALIPNSDGVELNASTLSVDFLSNGFKIRNTNGSYNNTSTYIFAAWAESPFTTANAK